MPLASLIPANCDETPYGGMSGSVHAVLPYKIYPSGNATNLSSVFVMPYVLMLCVGASVLAVVGTGVTICSMTGAMSSGPAGLNFNWIFQSCGAVSSGMVIRSGISSVASFTSAGMGGNSIR